MAVKTYRYKLFYLSILSIVIFIFISDYFEFLEYFASLQKKATSFITATEYNEQYIKLYTLNFIPLLFEDH
jgi:hypothetical protein